jgi:hypothetical protein
VAEQQTPVTRHGTLRVMMEAEAFGINTKIIMDRSISNFNGDNGLIWLSPTFLPLAQREDSLVQV